METFLYALRAVMPILLIMALGFAVRRLGSWDGAFYKRLNSLCFHLFLPVNLFCNVYAVENLSGMNWKLMGFMVLGILLTLVLGWVAAKVFVSERRQKGVVIQASFRANHAILGLPLAEALGGTAALGFASVTTAICVPVYNTLAVLVLSYYSGRERPSGWEMVKRVVKNPLIQSTILALVCVIVRSLLKLDVPLLKRIPSIWSALSSLSKIASPVMIFALGAGLDFRSVGDLLPKVSLGVLLRLVLSPVLVIGTALLLWEPLHLSVTEMPAMIAACASPVAVSSAVMTQEIGGDDQLASHLVVWTSVFSMLTIFLLVYFLRMMGAL